MKIWNSFRSVSLFGQIAIVLSLMLLIASLTQPAFYIDREDPAAWADSWLLFFFGWSFPLGGALIPFLFWCANPIYIFSLIQTLKGDKVGFYLSALSSAVALAFSQMDTIITSESGSESPIKSLELGYKLWVASFVVMTIGTGVNLYLKSRKSQ
jgi:hypothetical protein